MSNKIADFFAEIGIKVDVRKLERLDKQLDALAGKLQGFENKFKQANTSIGKGAAGAVKSQDKLTDSVRRTTQSVSKQSDVFSQHFKSIEAKAQSFNRKLQDIQSRHTKSGRVAEFKQKLITVNKQVNEVVDKSKPRIRVGQDGKIIPAPDKFVDTKSAIRDRLAGGKGNGFNRMAHAESVQAQARIKVQADAQKVLDDQKAQSYEAEKVRQQYLAKAQQEYARQMDRMSKAEQRSQEKLARQQKSKQRVENAILKDRLALKLRNLQVGAAELRGISQRQRMVQANKASATKQSLANVRLEAARSRLQATQARTQATLSRVTSGAPNNPYHAIAQSLQGLSGRVQSASAGGYGLLDAASGVARFTSSIGPAGLALGGLAAVAVGATAAIQGLVNAGTKTIDRGDAAKGSTYNFLGLAKGNQKLGEQYEADYLIRSQKLGIDYESSVKDASSAMLNLSSGGMKANNSQEVVNGVLTYAKSKGLDSEAIKGTLKAIQQMSSKGQAYAEEVKGQLAEHLPASESIFARAWTKVNTGKTVNPDDSKDIQSSMAALNKSMKDGDIKGEKLNQVLVVFARLLEGDANKNGQLSAAMRSNESDQNRIKNMKFVNAMSAYNDEDQQLGKSRHQFNTALVDFEAAARPANIALGRLETSAIQLSDSLTRFSTGVLYYLNRYLPGGGFQPRTDVQSGADSKAYTDSLAQFKVKDEKTGQLRDADQVERADMFMSWMAENRRLVGGKLSDKEYAEQRAYALSTPKEKLQGQMRIGNNISTIRDGSLKFAESLNNATQRSIDAALTPDRASPLQPGLNLLTPENAKRLLQMQEQQKDPAQIIYSGRVDRTPPAAPVVNQTLNLGSMVVNGTSDPVSTANAVREELQRVFSTSAAGIGEETQ